MDDHKLIQNLIKISQVAQSSLFDVRNSQTFITHTTCVSKSVARC